MSFDRIRALNHLTRELENAASALAMLALHCEHPSRVRQAAHDYMTKLKMKNSLEFGGNP